VMGRYAFAVTTLSTLFTHVPLSLSSGNLVVATRQLCFAAGIAGVPQSNGSLRCFGGRLSYIVTGLCQFYSL